MNIRKFIIGTFGAVLLRMLALGLIITVAISAANSAQAQSNSCNLSGSPTCNAGNNVAGSVSISADGGYDILIDGNKVAQSSYSWNTTQTSRGLHSLQECGTQPAVAQTCTTTYVPNLVWVPSEVYDPNVNCSQVWVDNPVCVAYDDNGDCTDYQDQGYYETTCAGGYVDQGSYVDEGSNQTKCSGGSSAQSVCGPAYTVNVVETLSQCLTPDPTNGPNQIRVYRFWKGGDRMITNSLNEGCGAGYLRESSFLFYASPVPGSDMAAVYRCWAPGTHFFSMDPGCETFTTESVVGYLHRNPTSGAVPIYRLWNRNDGDHLMSYLADEGASVGFIEESAIGYGPAF